MLASHNFSWAPKIQIKIKVGRSQVTGIAGYHCRPRFAQLKILHVKKVQRGNITVKNNQHRSLSHRPKRAMLTQHQALQYPLDGEMIMEQLPVKRDHQSKQMNQLLYTREHQSEFHSG